MTFTSLKRPLAILALGALAACGGGSTGPTFTQGTPPVTVPSGGTALVGIGDSLTAGFQSNGFLGDTTATFLGSTTPPAPPSLYPGNAIPPGQENGWWALMYQAVTGASTASLYNAATSPLPLIKAPGLGSQEVLTAALFTPVQSACSPVNDEAFSSTGWTQTRLSPTDQNTDLGVPGITMHEAVTMTGPITGPPNTTSCGYQLIAGNATSGPLQSLVAGESGVFYPVMGSYLNTTSGKNLTELNVALALHPKLTTVWLGANDVLKFALSGGVPVASDTPTQMQADLTTIVKSLTASGSKVIVGDLPNVLSAPIFFPQGPRLVADLTTALAGLSKGAVSATVAQQLATGISTYLAQQYGVGAGGYITEPAFFTIVTDCLAPTSTTPPCTAPNLDPTTSGSGLGANYITPAFATQIQSLNTAYNTAIDSVATGSGPNVALAPITTTFAALAPSLTSPGVAPPLSTIAPGAPTATFQFGGGLVSWDGLHPSNLGYAVIANIFIGTADQAFGMTLAPVSNTQLAAIATTDPYSGAGVDQALGGPLFPLP